MEITFKNNKLEKSLTLDNNLIKSYGKIAKKLKQRLGELKSANNLKIIYDIKNLRLHHYKGDRNGQWTIDIQENWRICFEIDQDPIPHLESGGVDLNIISKIKILSIEDPH